MALNMCDLCQSIKKTETVNAEQPEQNSCFESRRYAENYKPFKKDKTIIRLTCDGFSHIQTAVLGLRRGGRITLRATPETPKIELANLGPLFGNNSTGKIE